MNRLGHIWFALGLAAVAIYLFKDLEIIFLSWKTILFYLPFYLVGAILVDKLEPSTSR